MIMTDDNNIYSNIKYIQRLHQITNEVYRERKRNIISPSPARFY